MTFFDVLAPLYYTFDPSKRLFFIYILSSFILAVLVLCRSKRDFFEFSTKLLHPKIWLHHSTKIDFQLLFLNAALKSILFFFVSISAVVVAKFVVKNLYFIFPHHRNYVLSYQYAVLMYSVVSFVAIDFSRFFQHYLFHKIPFLWSFHKIHHSAEVMTPVTLYRTHPFESLVSAFRQIMVLGLLSGVFLFYTQSLISAYVIFGVNAIDFVFNFLGSNLRHSHVWLSFGPLNYLFVSPAQHQIHHSRNHKHFDKNLGFSLSLWDQLFGTFYQVKKKEFLIFGVRGERYKNILEAVMAPVRGLPRRNL